MLSFVLQGLLPEGLLLQRIFSSVLLLPDISIFQSFLKNVVISNSENVILEVADPRSVFYSGKRARCPSKYSSAFQIPNSNPSFLFFFPLPSHLSLEGRLLHSTLCLIPHELCLFHAYITFDFCLPLSVSEFIQFRTCNGFKADEICHSGMAWTVLDVFTFLTQKVKSFNKMMSFLSNFLL